MSFDFEEIDHHAEGTRQNYLPNEKINANRLLDWILEEEAEKAGCCRGRQATHTHGGGRATSAPSSPNGSTTTSKVYSSPFPSDTISAYFIESLIWDLTDYGSIYKLQNDPHS
jgi:hypothetical protein